jgi:hypothetical protein
VGLYHELEACDDVTYVDDDSSAFVMMLPLAVTKC